MEIRPIKTKKDYQLALARLELIFDAKKNSKEGDELEILSILIIKFRMEQLGYTQTDLAKVVGLKSRASEILNKKRKLTLEMVRLIHSNMNIPTDVLIQSYS
jgi:HTH-type transcriptional regulator/antitoxin HigA